MTDSGRSRAAAIRSPRTTVVRWFCKSVDAEVNELAALWWSFLYFFSLLCGYYIVRPIRDEMGIAGGVEHLHWMFTGTFLTMLAAVPLFGWLVSRFPRHRFMPYVYLFFVSNILIFYVLFRSEITHEYVARAFFIWVSVYNLFIVSVFWSYMADVFRPAQAQRLFGFIAAGGTLGALIGPVLTALLVTRLGNTNLLLVSAAFLLIAIVCIGRLAAWSRAYQQSATAHEHQADSAEGKAPTAMGGSVLAGFHLVARSPYLLGICALMLLLTTLATFLYFQQAEIVRDSFQDPARRTAVFAALDFAVNALTIVFQVFLTGRLTRLLGLSWTLALIPIGLGIGFMALALSPVLAVLIAVQVIRRAGNYAIMRPAREMLYTVLKPEEKYKAKNFIDTAVYRGGDAVSAWLYAGLASGLGMSLAAIAWISVPVAAVWAWIAFQLGTRQEAVARSADL